MAPLDSKFTDAAQRRADLLVELCSGNALISPERLLKQELRCVLGLDTKAPDPFSINGEWYPEGAAEISPVSQLQMGEHINDAIRDLGLNREARRRTEKIALRSGKPRTALRNSLIDNARNGSLSEILDKYPMRPEAARVLSRFAVGDATEQEATNAFLESLRDPRWMVKWFAQHHRQLSPFIQWTRGPAASMVDALSEMTKFAAELHRSDQDFGTTVAKDLIVDRWLRSQDTLVSRIATRLATALLDVNVNQLAPNAIDRVCPGLSVSIRGLHSAWATSITKTPRGPKPSDFLDAVHSMYAPYMDFFRADAFMSPLIAKQITNSNACVISKITDLPNAIRTALVAVQ